MSYDEVTWLRNPTPVLAQSVNLRRETRRIMKPGLRPLGDDWRFLRWQIGPDYRSQLWKHRTTGELRWYDVRPEDEIEQERYVSDWAEAPS